MKPILHLLGDKYKAQQFIRFAERKLGEMKRVMDRQRLSMQNKLIRFTTDDIEIYLESHRGIDKIRIMVGTVSACGFVDFSADIVEGSAPLTVNFTSSFRAFTPTEFLWDFGDKKGFSSLQDPSYTYETSGTYTVTLSAWNASSPDTNNTQSYFQAQKGSSSFKATNAEAYSSFQSEPWVISQGSATPIEPEYFVFKNAGGAMRYVATSLVSFKSPMDVDLLLGIRVRVAAAILESGVLVRNPSDPPQEFLDLDSSEIPASLMRFLDMSRDKNSDYHSSVANTNPSSWMITDKNNFPFLTEPVSTLEATGWASVVERRRISPICKIGSSKTDLITVT